MRIPQDMYNPKVMLKLSELRCVICGQYLESRASVGRHRRAVHPRVRAGEPPLPTLLEITNFSLEQAEGIIDEREVWLRTSIIIFEQSIKAIFFKANIY